MTIQTQMPLRNVRSDNLKPGTGVHLFVLIDALGWTYIQDREFLNDLLPNRQPLRTVLGFSSGAIPSILTGVPPSQNGHWNLFYYDPKSSPFWWLRYLQFLPNSILDCRVSSKLIKELGRHVLGAGPLFDCYVKPHLLHYFNFIEKRNIYAPGGISGAPSIFDRLQAEHKSFHVYSYHNYTDKEALQQAKRDVQECGAGFYFLYLSEFDALLHEHCTNPPKVEDKLHFYGEALCELLSVARKKDPDADMTVFSDHGMTPIHTHCDLATQVEGLGLQMPRDYLAVYDSTMVRFWLFSDAAREKITKLLAASRFGRILRDPELQELGIYFPDHRYGDTVFLLHPGWLLVRSDFNGPQWMPIGMHGYHPDDAYSDGIFLSSNPPPVKLSSVMDVYHCMRAAV